MDELQKKTQQEVSMREELEATRNSLELGRKKLLEVTLDNDRLKSLCDENGTTIKVSYNINFLFLLLLNWICLFIHPIYIYSLDLDV